ncbi:hypothetical protein EDB89DRAFT_1845059 [Lactarius sanguifluus]|nr:hypothetical protein EDB89DRAFT_1845059 [Lactarius sanguifluus]
MDKQQPGRRIPKIQIPKIQFRVLIIGRANAGKTTILQRIGGTLDSSVIYRKGVWGEEIVRGRTPLSESLVSLPTSQRGEHNIDDELVFSNHTGYTFHDSRGIEAGSTGELGILWEFIRHKCGERRLEDRLHAIWYCVPMDNQRPQLDLKYFKDICPDQNVPVIVVFTKYDLFLRNVQMHVEDFGSPDDNVFDVAEKRFQEHYLRPLGSRSDYSLAEMHMQNMRCDKLIETTAAALNEDIVALMLLAVQKSNLGLSVKTALNRWVRQLKGRGE